ncbi:hypothetical protein V1502_08760 [Bacillus sp. SCS-153A]|uniref:hypothetical protein n=1 Tax=Rossellomorea sedimentorum TaxID=3115294 RepID=UPI003906BC7E
MKKLHLMTLAFSLSASIFLAGCMEEGRMSPEEEDVDVVDPGLGDEDSEAEEIESN